jgi:flavin-dependent dehydrogenase
MTAAERYEDAWRREIGGELRDSLLIQRYLFRDPARIDGVVRNAKACRDIADLIIAYAMGTIPYSEARWRILRRFPRVVFRLARVALSA